MLKSEIINIKATIHIFKINARIISDHKSFVDHSCHCWKMASEPGLLTIRTIVERWRANQVCWPFAPLLKDGEQTRFVDHSRHCWKMASEPGCWPFAPLLKDGEWTRFVDHSASKPGLFTICAIVERWRANQFCWSFLPLLKDGERTRFVDHSHHCWKMASEPGLLTIRTIVERWQANQIC